MFVGITNTPRDYAWGAPGAISGLLGHAASGGPEAELWLGTHPGSPSTTEHGEELGRVAGTLPFLLKVLAAAGPLSLQAHPTLDQARSGFAAEVAAGIPIDAPHRNYRDQMHKPELLYALEPGFRALCGFRPTVETRAALAGLGTADPSGTIDGFAERIRDDDDLPDVFEWLLTRGPGADDVIASVSAAAASTEGFRTAAELATAYPGDPGIVIALLLNDVVLDRGQVIYLPAGNLHAYLGGIGVELMAASDNVLRGGLTPKHVDVRELLRVVDFSTGPVPYLEPERPAPGVEVFRPGIPDFVLTVVSGDAVLPPLKGAVLLCVAGEFVVEGGDDGRRGLSRGDAVFARTAGASTVRGAGTLFVASAG